jgi:hypothetical protein
MNRADVVTLVIGLSVVVGMTLLAVGWWLATDSLDIDRLWLYGGLEAGIIGAVIGWFVGRWVVARLFSR